MGKIDVFSLVLTKLNTELGLAQPQLVFFIVSRSVDGSILWKKVWKQAGAELCQAQGLA